MSARLTPVRSQSAFSVRRSPGLKWSEKIARLRVETVKARKDCSSRRTLNLVVALIWSPELDRIILSALGERSCLIARLVILSDSLLQLARCQAPRGAKGLA